MSVLFSSVELNNGLTKPKFRTQPSRPGKREDDLLVFGYACTIHEDSSKALYFEQEKHLIPWMGDETFLIDRYDARLHFTDQSQFVPKQSDLNQKLSTEEEEIERLCDEERYCNLDKDTREHEIYQEEEMKRFQQAVAYDGAYNAAPFLYGNSTAIDQQPQKQYDPSSCGSHYPGVMPGPQTVNQETMQPGGVTLDSSSEVQAENEEAVMQELEPFVPPEELDVPHDVEIPETDKMNAIIEKTALFVSKQGQQMEILIKAKQSGNPQFEFLNFENWLNPYYKHMLKYVKEGKYTPQVAKEPATPPPEEPKEPEEQEDLDDESDGEYELHPLLQASLHKKIGNSSQTSSPDVDKMFGMNFMRSFQPAGIPSSVVPVTSGSQETCTTSEMQEHVDQHDMWYTAALMYHNQGSEFPISQSAYGPATFDSYMTSSAYHYLPPGASVTSVADMIPPPPPPPGEGPLEEEWMDTPSTSSLPVLPPPPHPSFMLPEVMSGVFAATPAPPGVLPVPHASEIVPPPPDIQPIVDKLADYVARNGGDFEATVKRKNDDRFAFLNPWDVHHPYYLYRKQLCKEGIEKQGSGPDQHNVSSSAVVKGPISFSIKAKDSKKPKIEYRTSVIYKQSCELGESDEEEDKENEEKSEEEKETSENGDKRSTLETAGSEEQSETGQANEQARDLKEQMMSIEATEREVMRLEAESRDRQIQSERRRRASLFISMLKKTSGGASEGSPPHPRTDDGPIFDDADSLGFDEPAVKRPRFREKPLMSGVGAPSNDSIRVTQDLMAKVKAASKR